MLLIIAAATFFVALALAVAFLSDKWLVRVVAAVIIIQQLATVGLSLSLCLSVAHLLYLCVCLASLFVSVSLSVSVSVH